MKKLAINAYTEGDALKEVENAYASLEDFCLRIYAMSEEQKEALLGDDVSWDKKAGFLKISKRAAMYIMLRSEAFQRVMSQLSVRDRWNFMAQDKANAQFAKDTRNTQEKPEARVKVAQYLNTVSGITQDDTSKGKGLTINLTFGEGNASLQELQASIGGNGGDSEEKTITVQETLGPNGRPLPPYKPARSGDPEPVGVRLLQDSQVKRLRDGDSLLPEAAPRPAFGSGPVIEDIGETGIQRKPERQVSESATGFSDLFG